MPPSKISNRALKNLVADLLKSATADKIPESLVAYSGHQVIRVLFSFLCEQDRVVRWRAVATMGHLATLLAEEDMEKARDVMRRLMWILNEESGSSGWGAPEAMAEIIVRHEGLAKEYMSVFISYMDPNSNYLENPYLQRDLLYGLARLGSGPFSPLPKDSVNKYLPSYFFSEDPLVRGLAVFCAAIFNPQDASESLHKLLEDRTEITIYLNEEEARYTISALAQRALNNY